MALPLPNYKEFIMIDFGTTIRKWRKKRDLKQDKLAQRLGVTSTYLSSLENNRKEPSIGLLNSICKELNIPREIFFWDSISTDDIDKINLKSKKILRAAKQIVDAYCQEN